MEQLLTQIVTTAKGMWRHRWLALAVAWAVAIVGGIIAFSIPDKYEASARVFVDTQSILKPLMSGLAIQPNVEQQVGMLSRTLISRPNMEKLVRMADLDLGAKSKAEQDEVITSLMDAVQIKSTGRDNLYTLSYRAARPDQAQRVVQALVSMFVESSLGGSRKDAQSAKAFIEDQIKAYEVKLDEAETRLKEFRIRNIEMNNVEGKDSTAKISDLSQQLREARLALREAEQAREAAKQQLKSASSMAAPSLLSMPDAPDLGGNTAEIDARIAAQNRNLDSLLQRYTEQHPDVVGARRLIKDLEAQKRKELDDQRAVAAAAAAAAASAASAADSSAAVGALGAMAQQEMGKMLATYDLQVASLKARVNEYEQRYKNAVEMLKTAPQLEAEEARLTRDHAIHKRNYEDLVARRERASMSGELESAAGVVDFRLIDPPRVSPEPVAPNRFALLALACAISLAAGIATAFLASQLRPVFHSAADLRNKVAVPLLGVVSMVSSAIEVRRERISMLRFMAGSGGLVGTFILAFLVMTILAARKVA